MPTSVSRTNALLFVALSIIASSASAAAPTPERPNIIVVLADDMGFSDLSCFGGEVPTPNIDRLATNGVRFTQFYNMARCCPSRAALLTGLYSHQAGVGNMLQDRGPEHPDYRGFLSDRSVTLAGSNRQDR